MKTNLDLGKWLENILDNLPSPEEIKLISTTAS